VLVAKPLLIAAALGAFLGIPGSAGAGDSWLVVTPRPAEPYILTSGSQRECMVALDVKNRSDRRVRVAAMRVTYLEGESVVGVLESGSELFVRAGLDSDPALDAGAHATWGGMCLDPPSAKVDRVRFALDLVQRRGLRTIHAPQSVDVVLRAKTAGFPLSLPIRGAWRVTQGHTCETQHRRGRVGGEFAWDLVAINESGRSVSPSHAATHVNADTETFGRTIVSPVDGTVVDVVDGVPDNEGMTDFPRKSIVDEARDPKWIYGNHVVIDAGGGAYVLLAHLKRGSPRVKKGSVVRAGDSIAQAGNSGNTVDPHLHVQVMDGPDAASPDIAGIPAVFTDYIEIAAVGSGNGEVVRRRVASGDPPQGAVMLSPTTPGPLAR